MHECRRPEQDDAAERERRPEPDARRGHRAAQRAQHLPHGHRELHRRHLAAHLRGIGPPARDDERERRRRAHRAQDEPGDEELRERVGDRHPHERHALEDLHQEVLGPGIAALSHAAPRGTRQHGDERRDAEDPSGPAECRRGIVGADRLDVEGQADEGERPGEAPEEHRDREGTRDPGHPAALGIVTEPIAAASAADEPETSEKKIVATITTRPRPPGKWRTRTFARFTSRRPTPPVSRNAPARTKSGTASTGNESSDVKIFWGRTRRGVRPSMTVVTSAASPSEKDTGALRSRSAPKTPNRRAVTPAAARAPAPPRAGREAPRHQRGGDRDRGVRPGSSGARAPPTAGRGPATPATRRARRGVAAKAAHSQVDARPRAGVRRRLGKRLVRRSSEKWTPRSTPRAAPRSATHTNR